MTVTAFLVLSLRSHRFIFYFTLFALPVIARPLQSAGVACWRRVSAGDELARRWLASAWFAVATASLHAWQHHPRVAVSRHFPAGAVRFLQQRNIEGAPSSTIRITAVTCAGTPVGHPSSGDGRNLLFASLMEEVKTGHRSRKSRRSGRSTICCSPSSSTHVLVDQLDSSTLGGLSTGDDFAAVYLRRGGTFRGQSSRSHGLRFFPPFGGVEGLDARAQEAGLAAELRREFGAGADNRARLPARPSTCWGLLSFLPGRTANRPSGLLRQALAIRPDEFVSGALARVPESATGPVRRPHPSPGWDAPRFSRLTPPLRPTDVA